MEKPHKKEVELDRQCSFCERNAEYDFKTARGPWAYGCAEHYHRLSVPGSVLFTKLKRRSQ